MLYLTQAKIHLKQTLSQYFIVNNTIQRIKLTAYIRLSEQFHAEYLLYTPASI